MIIGIDPGLTGAIAFICPEEGVYFRDMPTQPKAYGKGREIDAMTLCTYFHCIGEPDIYVERVSAMPGQGVTSMFGFGYSAGVIAGILAAYDHDPVYVRPQDWKKAAGLTGCPKDAARELAVNLYPTAADALARKRDCGRADALLIAHFAADALH